MELTPLINSFIILLREGFEAMLIFILVFMYLDLLKQDTKEYILGNGGRCISLFSSVGFKQIVGLTSEREAR